MENNKRKCLECQEPLIGRADKKFCDDHCRNAYNNKLKASNNNLIRNVNNSLRKNHRILESLNPDGVKKVKKDTLLTKGFNFKYHTHTYKTKENALYHFCYDYGILALDNDWFLIVKRD